MKKLLFFLLLFSTLYAGAMFQQPGDYEKAINGDAKLADSFCPFYVIFDTGNVMLKDRSYIPVTKTMIYNLCKIGAEGGYPNSQKEFGYILLRENIPSLKIEAIKYFKLSAEQGNTDAKEMLAEMYAFHKDVEYYTPENESPLFYITPQRMNLHFSIKSIFMNESPLFN